MEKIDEKFKMFKNMGENFTDTDFTLDDTAKGLLLFLIFQTIVSNVYSYFYMLGATSNAWSIVFNVLLDATFILTVYIVSKLHKRQSFAFNIKVKRAPSILQAVICVCISLVCIFGFSALTNCFLELLYQAGYQSVSGDIEIVGFGSYLLYCITICVLPAISEEILFRGLMFNGLKKKSTVFAVFFSAFIFMIMHGSPDQTVHQFILGVVLALVYLQTNNLWVPILVHFFNNFIAVSYTYFLSFIESSSDAVVAEPLGNYLFTYFVYALISATISVFLLYVLFKALKSATQKQQEKINNKQPSMHADAYKVSGTLPPEIEIVNSNNFILVDEKGYQTNVASEIFDGDMAKDKQSNKLSKWGKIIYFICFGWLIFQWLLSLLMGFGVMGV